MKLQLFCINSWYLRTQNCIQTIVAPTVDSARLLPLCNVYVFLRSEMANMAPSDDTNSGVVVGSLGLLAGIEQLQIAIFPLYI